MTEFFSQNLHHFKQLTRYVISGGSAATVNLTILYLLTSRLHIWYLFSAILAYVISFFVSFFLQKFWTFRDGRKEQMHKQMTIYFFVALAGLGINTLFIYLFVDVFHIWYLSAQFIVSGFLAFSNFAIYKFFIFNRPIKQSAV